MTYDLTLVVLAAGMGSRYGGLKQIDGFGPDGESIIDYSIYDGLQAGFNKVIFVIKEEFKENFKERIGNRINRYCDVAYAYQRLDFIPPGYSVPADRVKPWGTAHATWASKDLVKTPFAVINADDFYGRESFQVLAKHMMTLDVQSQDYYISMVGFQLGKAVSEFGYVARGVCQVDEAGYLQEVIERTRIEVRGETIAYTENDGETWVDLPIDAVVSMNFWGFSLNIFDVFENLFIDFLSTPGRDLSKEEFFLPFIINEMIKTGKAKARVIPTAEKWFGVTYQQDKGLVQYAIKNLIKQGIYPSRLWSNQ